MDFLDFLGGADYISGMLLLVKENDIGIDLHQDKFHANGGMVRAPKLDILLFRGGHRVRVTERHVLGWRLILENRLTKRLVARRIQVQ